MSRPHRRALRLAARRHLAASFGLVAIVSSAPPLRADVPPAEETRARDAYQRAAIAYQHGDYARAAREFATADSIAPDPVTLRVALGAATMADEPVLGTELIERAARVGTIADKALAEALRAAHARFDHRTGRIVARCPGAQRCLATIDGVPAVPAVGHIVTLGLHTVALQGDGAIEQRMIEVAADQTIDVVPTVAPLDTPAPIPAASPSAPAPSVPQLPAPPEPRAHSHERSGIAPGWFVASAAITAAMGGLSIASAVDTSNRHARFDDADCGRGPGPSCAGLQSDGLASERRTNAFFIATGALAAATLAIGVFWVRWTNASEPSVGLVVRGGEAQLRATF